MAATNSTRLRACLMITGMTVMMLGLSPLLRPIPIHHTDDRPPLLADGPPSKGEGTHIRIQGNATTSCAAYTGTEVRTCSYLTCTLMERRSWLKHVKAASCLSLSTIQQRLGL